MQTAYETLAFSSAEDLKELINTLLFPRDRLNLAVQRARDSYAASPNHPDTLAMLAIINHGGLCSFVSQEDAPYVDSASCCEWALDTWLALQ